MSDDPTLTWRAVLAASGEPVPEPPAPRSIAPALALPERYQDLGFLAEGGVGEVRRVRDLKLDAELVMKLQRRRATPAMRARFAREARLTARMHHPNIVPAVDLGELDDGTAWFTMPEVRGQTLREVVDGYVGAAAQERTFRLRRAVELVAEVARALAYAHEQGVVHRDVKPQNLMVGRFGEVRVMDFGVALDLRRPDPELDDAVVGTPLYMAPEQARGDTPRCGPPIDVYALGVLLYELLAGAPPYTGSGIAVWHQIIEGPPVDPADHARAADAPAELLDPTRASMQRDRDRRPTALEVADRLVAWLDGEGRRERARRLVADAAPLAEALAETARRATARAAEARARLEPLPSWAPTSRKEPAFLLEDEASRDLLEVRRQEARYVQQLQAALHQDPECESAHARLADFHRARLAEAEARHAPAEEAEHEEGLRAHDRGQHAAFLRGRSAVSVHTDPEGAEVVAVRLVHRGRRWQDDERVRLGRTPLREAELPFGNWRLEIRAEGRPLVVQPVRLRRAQHHIAVRPGGSEPFVIPLPERLDPDDCYVPGGWFEVGGDPDAMDPLPRAELWVDGFVIRRHPVTRAEYTTFLDALGPDAAPHVPPESQEDTTPACAWTDGRWRWRVPDQVRRPVTLIHTGDAVAYAAWRGARDGAPWRLPHEVEWEKAARGVDGRFHPWGNGFDPSFANVLGHLEGRPGLVDVGRGPHDVSPYGLRDLAGNARDLCGNGYRWRADGAALDPLARGEGPQVTRGGSWLSPATNTRCANRYVADRRFAAVSFRLARSYTGTWTDCSGRTG